MYTRHFGNKLHQDQLFSLIFNNCVLKAVHAHEETWIILYIPIKDVHFYKSALRDLIDTDENTTIQGGREPSEYIQNGVRSKYQCFSALCQGNA